jgi:hypothetical protein
LPWSEVIRRSHDDSLARGQLEVVDGPPLPVLQLECHLWRHTDLDLADGVAMNGEL